MAAALPTLQSHHILSLNLAIFGNNAQSMSVSSKRKLESSGKSRETVGCLSNSSRASSQNGILRRDLMFLGLSSSLSLAFPALGSGAEEELKTGAYYDNTTTYLEGIAVGSVRPPVFCEEETRLLGEFYFVLQRRGRDIVGKQNEKLSTDGSMMQ